MSKETFVEEHGRTLPVDERSRTLPVEEHRKKGFFERLFSDTDEPTTAKGKLEESEKVGTTSRTGVSTTSQPVLGEGKVMESGYSERGYSEHGYVEKPESQKGIMEKIGEMFTGPEPTSKARHESAISESYSRPSQYQKESMLPGGISGGVSSGVSGGTATTEFASEKEALGEKVVVSTEERALGGTETRQVDEKARRKVIEERVPQERIRYIEEVQRLSYPNLKAEGARVIDTKQNKLPIERKVVNVRQVRLPIEHIRVFEEVLPLEKVQVWEEQERERHGKLKEQKTVTGPTEAGAQVEQIATDQPVRRLVEEGDVTAVVEEIRTIEEIERIETVRVIEERIVLDQPKDVQDFQRQHYRKEEGMFP